MGGGLAPWVCGCFLVAAQPESSATRKQWSGYAAARISSRLNGRTSKFGWLQASATKLSSLSITFANPATIRIDSPPDRNILEVPTLRHCRSNVSPIPEVGCPACFRASDNRCGAGVICPAYLQSIGALSNDSIPYLGSQ